MGSYPASQLKLAKPRGVAWMDLAVKKQLGEITQLSTSTKNPVGWLSGLCRG